MSGTESGGVGGELGGEYWVSEQQQEEQVKKSKRRSDSHELKRKVDFNRILVTCSVSTFIPNKSRVLARFLFAVTYLLSVWLNAFR